MKRFETIAVDVKDFICTLWLARPDKRNAISRQMAAELTDFFKEAEENPAIRVVILRGQGDYFCAGGDLRWMSQGNDLQPQDRSGWVLANLYRSLYHFPKPLIALVHGAAMGGALGLIACADFVLAEDKAIFSFSEVKLGLVPATISPFVIRRIGENNAKQLMLSGKKVKAQEAIQYCLVDFQGEMKQMEQQALELAVRMAANAPEAMKACKRLIQQVAGKEIDESLSHYTAKLLTSLQESEEAKEGMQAFLEKREPVWPEKPNK
ncbi:MAG: enoyl-CoA hydratase-related protein [Bacteroides sp.]|jgi:methylglutaconyl-CoA hydratase|nr:enoyl-CoA hydratase-related protein [Bacteroides sp.]